MTKAEWIGLVAVSLSMLLFLGWFEVSRLADDDTPPPLPEPTITYTSAPQPEKDRVFR